MEDIKTELVKHSVNLERFYRRHGKPNTSDVVLVVSLDAALEIVKDAPTTYWGTAMLDAPDGRYYTTYPNGQSNVTPHGVDGLPKSFARTFADDPDAWFFGPLPTSPNQGEVKE